LDSIRSLATAAAAGDAASTSELLERMWPDAFRIAWSVTGERTAAEDAAQEACARALIAVARLRQPELFRAWFYRIVVNEARRRMRGSRDEASLDVVAERAAGTGDAFEERLDLHRALERLEAPLRVVTVLSYFFDLDGNEIGKIVGASPMTVRWRLFRARKRLRTLLVPAPATSLPALKKVGDYADESHAVG
jgi:RNA polymerase sigma factor (sigma-70 family)